MRRALLALLCAAALLATADGFDGHVAACADDDACVLRALRRDGAVAEDLQEGSSSARRRTEGSSTGRRRRRRSFVTPGALCIAGG